MAEMEYGCWLCTVSPSADTPMGDREDILEHLQSDHNAMEPTDYLRELSEQTTL